MSQQDSNAGSQAADSQQEEQEEEKLEPPHPATREQIMGGLSRIQRTHGKQNLIQNCVTCFAFNYLRRKLIRVRLAHLGGAGPSC